MQVLAIILYGILICTQLRKGANCGICNVLQMALWTTGPRLYLPPAPIAPVLCTDDYTVRKGIYYHGDTERLIYVGHPQYHIVGPTGDHVVPKCSPNQWRVFRVKLPDPNNFALPDSNVHDPNKERLVWAMRAVQVSRGQPLNPSVIGHPFFNSYMDAESLTKKTADQKDDDRKLAGMDPKQCQFLLVGAKPAIGEYWDFADECPKQQHLPGECKPIELRNKPIEDGDMMEIGFGAANFKNFNANKSDLPLDICQSTCVYPDFIKMTEEAAGDDMFFFARKESVFARHIFARGGNERESPPDDCILTSTENKNRLANFNTTPSGSLISTDGQLFNRPYYMLRAQGMNNGICWNNEVFITVGDNTRGTPMCISILQDPEAKTYNSKEINHFLRHAEEYKLSIILELCGVPLTNEVLGYLNVLQPDVLKNWEITVSTQNNTLEDQYRYLSSWATRCPPDEPAEKSKDPYSKYTFWNIDFRERLSLDLNQYPLGRRFLTQIGVGIGRRSSTPRKPTKRKLIKTTATSGGKRRKT